MAGRTGRYKTYSIESLAEAIRFVKEDGGSIKLAARQFGVPPSTLNDHLKKLQTQSNKEWFGNTTESDNDDSEKKITRNVLKVPVIPKAKVSESDYSNRRRTRSSGETTPSNKKNLKREISQNDVKLISLSPPPDDYYCDEGSFDEGNSSHLDTDTFTEHKKKRYSQEKMYAAYEHLISHPKESISMVARTYGVPITTLRDRWTGRVKVSPPLTFRPILPKPPDYEEKRDTSKKPEPDKNKKSSKSKVAVPQLSSLPIAIASAASQPPALVSPTGPPQIIQSPSTSASVLSPPPLSTVPAVRPYYKYSTRTEKTTAKKTKTVATVATKEDEYLNTRSSFDRWSKIGESRAKSQSPNPEDQETDHRDQTENSEIQQDPSQSADLLPEAGAPDNESPIIMPDIQIKQEPVDFDSECLYESVTYDQSYEDDQSPFNPPKKEDAKQKSGKHHIPVTVRLIYNNNSPNKETKEKKTNSKRKSYKRYPREALQKAVHYIFTQGGSPSKASSIFGVPISTIGDRLRQLGYLRRPKPNSGSSSQTRRSKRLVTPSSSVTSLEFEEEDSTYPTMVSLPNFSSHMSSEQSLDEGILAGNPVVLEQDDGGSIMLDYQHEVQEYIYDDTMIRNDNEGNTIEVENSDLYEEPQNFVQNMVGPGQTESESSYNNSWSQENEVQMLEDPTSLSSQKDAPRNYRKYSAESLEKACDYVMIEEKTVSEASRLFGVPISTIWDRLKKIKQTAEKNPELNELCSLRSKKWSKAVASGNATEKRLSWYLFEMAEIGYRFGDEEIMQIASQENSDMDTWLCGLLDVSPTVSNVLGGYNFTITDTMINFYYNKLDQLLEEKQLFESPEHVYMIDMICIDFEWCPRVFEPHRGTPSFKRRNQEANTVVMIACVNAIGTALPPYFIFPSSNSCKLHKKLKLPGSQYKFAIDGKCMSYYFDTFMKEHFCRFAQVGLNGTKLPVVVLYNAYQIPVTLNILTWTGKNNIHMFALPPHSYSSSLIGGTSQVTSADIGLFGSDFEKTFTKKYSETKSKMNSLIYCFRRLLTYENIVDKFESLGVFPVNLRMYSKLQLKHSSNSDGLSIKEEPMDTYSSDANSNLRDEVQKSLTTSNSSNSTSNVTNNEASDIKITAVTSLSDECCITSTTDNNEVQNSPTTPSESPHRRKRKGQPRQAIIVKKTRDDDDAEESGASNDSDKMSSVYLVDSIKKESEDSGVHDQGKSDDKKEGAADVLTVAGYTITLADDDEEED